VRALAVCAAMCLLGCVSNGRIPPAGAGEATSSVDSKAQFFAGTYRMTTPLLGSAVLELHEDGSCNEWTASSTPDPADLHGSWRADEARLFLRLSPANNGQDAEEVTYLLFPDVGGQLTFVDEYSVETFGYQGYANAVWLRRDDGFAGWPCEEMSSGGR
jgi:hypothetical protein